MDAHRFARLTSAVVFAIAALVWLNAFLTQTGRAYTAAIVWLLLALVSHVVEKRVEGKTVS